MAGLGLDANEGGLSVDFSFFLSAFASVRLCEDFLVVFIFFVEIE